VFYSYDPAAVQSRIARDARAKQDNPRLAPGSQGQIAFKALFFMRKKPSISIDHKVKLAYILF
jgi:hypothetical protein